MILFRLIVALPVVLAVSFACASSGGLPDDIMTTTEPVASEPVVSKPATPARKDKKKSETTAKTDKQETTKPASGAETKPANNTATKNASNSANQKLAKGSEAPAAIQAPEIEALKGIDKRYQAAKSIAMDLDKTLLLGLLGKERKSKGRLLLSKGKMRMEIESPEKSVIVVDGKMLWVADYPPAEFKNAAVQVLKGKLDSKTGVQQSFVGLLTRGGILKHFKVTGVQKDDKQRNVYFLTPAKQSFEFKRAQITATPDGKAIAELKYWDERDNETRYQFSNVKFDGSLPPKSFEFVPPENADITTL